MYLLSSLVLRVMFSFFLAPSAHGFRKRRWWWIVSPTFDVLSQSEGEFLEPQRVLLHECDEALARRDLAVEHLRDAVEDRVLEVLPVALDARVDHPGERARRRYAFGHLRHRAEDLVEALAPPEAHAHLPVARERAEARAERVADARQPKDLYFFYLRFRTDFVLALTSVLQLFF